MTPDFVTQIIRDALMAAFWLSAPLLAVMFVVGLVVSLVQIVTSIQDSAVNSVPRLICALTAALLGMPWMLRKAMTYTSSLLGNLSRYAQ